MLFDGTCAALDVVPPDEPPEPTSGTDEGSEALRQWGTEGATVQGSAWGPPGGSCSGRENKPPGGPTSNPLTIGPTSQRPAWRYDRPTQPQEGSGDLAYDSLRLGYAVAVHVTVGPVVEEALVVGASLLEITAFQGNLTEEIVAADVQGRSEHPSRP